MDELCQAIVTKATCHAHPIWFHIDKYVQILYVHYVFLQRTSFILMCLTCVLLTYKINMLYCYKSLINEKNERKEWTFMDLIYIF
jgi:hypothetical protein